MKFTLNIDENIIKQAKLYSKLKGVSVSKLVERYLKEITSELNISNENRIESWKELSGVINLPEDFNEKEFLKEEKSKDLLK